jgi:hypothetical protein
MSAHQTIEGTEYVGSLAPGVKVFDVAVFDGTLYLTTSDGVYFKAGSRFFRLELEAAP